MVVTGKCDAAGHAVTFVIETYFGDKIQKE